MSYNIRFTISAKNDLNSIKKYICNDNYNIAKQVIKDIIESIENLKSNPAMGRAGRVLRTRELIIPRYPYIVPYQVKDNNIYVLRVLHTSRIWEDNDSIISNTLL